MKEKINLQELAEFMRDVAYSHNHSHNIEWHLSVIHPRTENGDIGYSGGIWHRKEIDHRVSVSFSYSQSKGIYNFKLFEYGFERRFSFGELPAFEEFKETIIRKFEVKKLFQES